REGGALPYRSSWRCSGQKNSMGLDEKQGLLVYDGRAKQQQERASRSFHDMGRWEQCRTEDGVETDQENSNQLSRIGRRGGRNDFDQTVSGGAARRGG
ncbi:MAG TPA: hypothetical protein VNG91_00255, partial [Terriglobia bacterium]|nr:hypothetical protein [Terriglobia bacterium]